MSLSALDLMDTLLQTQQQYQQHVSEQHLLVTDTPPNLYVSSTYSFPSVTGMMPPPVSVPPMSMAPSPQSSSSTPISTTSAAVVPSGSSTNGTVSYSTNGGGLERKQPSAADEYAAAAAAAAHIEEEYDPTHPSMSVTGSAKCDDLLRLFVTKPDFSLKNISVPNGLAMTDKDKKLLSLYSAKTVVKQEANKPIIGFVGGVRVLRSMPFADYNNGYHSREAKRRKLNSTSSSSTSTNNNHNRESDSPNATTSEDVSNQFVDEDNHENNEACNELLDNKNKMLRDILKRQRCDPNLTYLRSVDPDVFRFINKENNLTLVTLIPYFFLLGEQAQHINLTVFEHIQHPELFKDFIDLLYHESETNPISKLLAMYGDAICVVWLLLIKQYKMEIDELFANYRFDIEVNASDNSGYLGYMQKTKSTLILYNMKVTSMLENDLKRLVDEPNTARTITNLQLSAFSQICKEIRSLSITRNIIMQLLQCRLYKKVVISYRITEDTIQKNFVDDSVAAKLVYDSKEHWMYAAKKKCATAMERYNDSVCVTEPMILSNVDIIIENLFTRNKTKSVGSVYPYEIKYIVNQKNRELQYYRVFLRLLQRCGLNAEAKEHHDAILDETVIV